ncbi:hypothetical protein PLESTB_000875900 [Pleodorina starrii]|uniref:Helicase ATP-binding domain-containing protein n=1 Tax=Pleodorina starrii TaxID=330485 RepID=A0A9W6F3J8_9CHLO|nr:hypothetical protein PLESTB_000875900 [Pleodorina starrii]
MGVAARFDADRDLSDNNSSAFRWLSTSFGAGDGEYGDAVELIYGELCDMGLLDHDPPAEMAPRKYKCLAFALAAMSMSRKWPSNTLPRPLWSLNGLYINYLMECDLCAVIKTRQGKAFVSHSGLNDDVEYLYSLTGMESAGRWPNGPMPLEHVVSVMNDQWRVHMKYLSTMEYPSLSGEQLLRTLPFVQYMIHISADSGSHTDTDSGAVYSSRASLVNQPWNVFQDPRDRRRNNKFMLAGGAQSHPLQQQPRLQLPRPLPQAARWHSTMLTSYPLVKWKMYTSATATPTNIETIRFNIFGHQPRGAVPLVQYVNGTYHIDMDVSKIEGQTNHHSYALLVIPNTDTTSPYHEPPYVVGHILFKQHNNRNMYFTEKGLPQQLLLEILIQGNKLHLQYKATLKELDQLQIMPAKQIVARVDTTAIPTTKPFSVLLGYTLLRDGFINQYYFCNEGSKALDMEDAGAMTKEYVGDAFLQVERPMEQQQRQQGGVTRNVHAGRNILQAERMGLPCVNSKAECVRRVVNFAKLAKWTRFEDKNFDPAQLQRELPVLSPKLHSLVSKINELDSADSSLPDGRLHKHFIFSDVTGGFGAKAVVSALLASGFELVYDNELRRVAPQKVGNGVALLVSSTLFSKTFSVNKRRALMADYNARPENVHGDMVRVIVADGGFKEGMDLFDVRYVHMLEPQSSPADTRQVIGRATRSCGQQGLVFQPNVGWPLDVFVYDALMLDGRTTVSSEALRLAGIDMTRFQLAERLEHVCKVAAVDAELTSPIHGVLPVDEDTEQGPTGMDIDAPPELRDMLERGFDSTCTKATLPLSVHTMLFAWLAGPGSRVPTRLLQRDANKRAALCKLAHTDPLYAQRLREAIVVGEEAYILRHKEAVVRNLDADPNYQMLPAPFKKAMTAMIMDAAKDGALVAAPELVDLFMGKGARKRLGENNPDLPPHLAGLRGHIQRLYAKRFTWPGSRFENGCVENNEPGQHTRTAKPGGITLNATQAFLSAYFRPGTDAKGMLIWHSVGSGKTCSAIATASRNFEAHGYTILWVTRSTLKNDMLKNLEGPLSCHMSSKTSSWLPSLSYRQFTNLLQNKNKLYDALVRRNGRDDPLRKTLVVIDEAHKLFGGTDLKALERPDVKKLHAALMRSYERSGEDSVRLLLMTATPWVHDPLEIIRLLNLMRTPGQQLPDNYIRFRTEYLDESGATFTPEGRHKLLSQLTGYISFLDRSRDARQFAQPRLHHVLVPLSNGTNGRPNVQDTAAKAKELKAVYERDLAECIAKGEGKRGTIKACKQLLAHLERAAKDVALVARTANRQSKNDVDQISALQRCFSKR